MTSKVLLPTFGLSLVLAAAIVASLAVASPVASGAPATPVRSEGEWQRVFEDLLRMAPGFRVVSVAELKRIAAYYQDLVSDGRVPHTFETASGRSAYLGQLSQTGVAGQLGTFRPNIGVANTVPVSASVTVAISTAGGARVRSDTRTYASVIDDGSGDPTTRIMKRYTGLDARVLLAADLVECGRDLSEGGAGRSAQLPERSHPATSFA